MATHIKSLIRGLLGLGLLLIPVAAFADIDLLEPIGAAASIPTDGPPFSTFLTYFNLIYPWAIGCAAGIAVAWGLWGASGIILFGADQGKRSENIKHIQTAIVGLLVLLFAGTILHTINASFFKVS
jgi:hypothetical protein